MTSARPTVRLKPKIDPRRIRRGFPWVYANELVVDRRTKSLTPGVVATLEDAERKPVAAVTVNPGSKIICRVLDRDATADIDDDWIFARVAQAASLRNQVYDSPYFRLIHAEADGLPGVIVDLFGEVAFTNAANRRVATHLPQSFEILGKQQRAGTHPSSHSSSFGAGMAATNNDDIVLCLRSHRSTWVR